jgi:hypothetical protein
VAPGLRTGGPSADLIRMTSTASWLPAAITRAAVVSARPAQKVPSTGRHAAPEVPGAVRIATPEDLMRTGRHAETEWSRRRHDLKRDEADPMSWLDFTPSRH